MLSRRQRILNRYARYVQKPVLSAIKSPTLVRKAFSLSAVLFSKRPAGLQVDRLTLGTIPAYRCHIADAPEHGTLLYIHGGGFVIGDILSYRHLVARMAQAAGMRGVFVDYRPAPEHPFPAALDDVETAYRALLDTPDGGPICVVGDSAGGNLALALILRLKRRGLPLPAACACMSPVTDLRLQNPSLARNRKRDPLISPEWGARSVAQYLAGQSPEQEDASPILGDFTGAPPTYLCCDVTEVLYDDGRLMAEHLRKAGVAVTFSEHQGLPHVWQLNVGRSPEADASVAEIGTFLSRHATSAR